MLISHKHKFIYTKTAKTAGTSVESFFEKFCMAENEWEFSHRREEYESKDGIIGYRGADATGKKWFNHMPALEIKNKIGSTTWNEYFKFCVVRNPFDKLLSGFYFEKKPAVNGAVQQEPSEKERIDAFRNWIKRGGVVLDRDKYLIDGKVCLDYFIRYEELHKGMGEVCQKLNLPFDPAEIPKLKSGFRDHKIPIRDFYDAATIEIVKKVYAIELELFGYKLE